MDRKLGNKLHGLRHEHEHTYFAASQAPFKTIRSSHVSLMRKHGRFQRLWRLLWNSPKMILCRKNFKGLLSMHENYFVSIEPFGPNLMHTFEWTIQLSVPNRLQYLTSSALWYWSLALVSDGGQQFRWRKTKRGHLLWRHRIRSKTCWQRSQR